MADGKKFLSLEVFLFNLPYLRPEGSEQSMQVVGGSPVGSAERAVKTRWSSQQPPLSADVWG